ncbi:DUF3073 domain-containing protein [Jatrophihabitans fulvus]
MGRGRAKAKQQKVARELKYNTHFTDLDALQRELGTSSSGDARTSRPDAEDEDEYDEWTGTER